MPVYTKRWYVPKSDGAGNWIVALAIDGSYGCDCPAWKFHSPRRDCKHIKAVMAQDGDVKTVTPVGPKGTPEKAKPGIRLISESEYLEL